jgi:subtilisin family serine protease
MNPFKKALLIQAAFVIFLSINSMPLFAQIKNWQNLDLKTDSIFGISTEKAYSELLKRKSAKTVIVAVIDAGIDTTHEDLKSVLWHNPKEKPKNNKDDDKNGYVDDIYGWSFISSSKGNVLYDNIELTRQVRQGMLKFAGKDSTKIPTNDLASFKTWQNEKTNLDHQLGEAKDLDFRIKRAYHVIDTILNTIGTKEPTLTQMQAYIPRNERQGWIKDGLVQALKTNPDLNYFINNKMAKDLQRAEDDVNYHLNVNYDPRPIVGDDYFNSNQRNYGSNDVYGPAASHGTHVAGIIGAVRNNNIGVLGVADHVQIMAVRVVPEGDERDKDVANGIRYAVDNGAKVINMSFGKGYSQDKKAVDDAVKYAMAHDVLIVHAAGNGNENLDSIKNFPNRIYEDGSGTAEAWLEVGASGPYWDRNLKASFSNYGKNSVDVFAPGVQIMSTIPGSKYEAYDGTSMAAPVVSGLAALLWEYYPKLTAVQVKDIIMKSVVPFPHHVLVVKNGQHIPIEFSVFSRSGGIVNAYNAIKLAETYKAVN